MKNVLRISGHQGAYTVAESKGGKLGGIILWNVTNLTTETWTNVTFKKNANDTYPFKDAISIDQLGPGQTDTITAKIKKNLGLRSYKFDLVRDPAGTVILDPDIEVAEDLGLL